MTPWVVPKELRLMRNVHQVVCVTDDNGDKQPDAGILQFACDAANNLVDGYLGIAPPGFDSDQVEPALKYFAGVIALYILLKRYGVEDPVAKEDYDDAFIKLKEMISLPVAVIEEVTGGPIEGNRLESDLDPDIEAMASVVPEDFV